ncbi:MAG: glycosyltransferase family 4 protein [Deltaproteobacteria bacterium]|nr:glycosyltransferase family 4 protein [Deltaproteobacteria bacterium]
MRLLWFNLATDLDDPILGFTSAWIRAVARRVEAVHVITMRAGRLEFPENVRVYSVGKEKGYSESRRVLEFYRHLRGIIKYQGIEACFSHMIPIFSIMAAPLLKVRGIPLATWYAHPSLTPTLRLAHHLSDRMVASLAAAYPYRPDKLAVIGQGIDTDRFSPNGVKPAKPPIILCVGRLSRVKDHPTLLRAAALLRERWGRPFRVVIVGGPARPQDEEYVKSLHKLRRELNLLDLVKFHPAVPAVHLPFWYRRAAVHVNLTPCGFGDKVALEAMSCGVPCVLANEGFRRTLGEYGDLLLFAYQDPEDLTQKLQFFLTASKSERQRLGLYLRRQVVEQHSLADLAEKLIAVLREVQ